jgi:hypothetical protein
MEENMSAPSRSIKELQAGVSGGRCPVQASSNMEYDLCELIGPLEKVSKCYEHSAEDEEWLNCLPVGSEEL